MSEEPKASSIILTDDNGVLKQILQEGSGEVQPFDGCKVLCHYTGKLTDGTQFDSSVGREPFEFELGAGSVIKGFDLGVASMKKGEKSVFTFTPGYAYGSHGSPPNIPGNSTLIFELELLSWKPQDLSPKLDGGIERHMLTKKSEKRKSPADGALVQAHIIGKYVGRVFDERDVEFNVCEVPEEEVISGIQHALLHFGKDETSRLVIQPQYAFGATGHKEFNIPPNATVEYTVTLNNFEKDNKTWKFDEAESIEQAKLYKEKGIGFYKIEKYELSVKMYNKSNSYLSNCSNAESQQIKVAVHLNIALCYQKLDDHFNVKTACNTALEIEPNNIKALYRRGTSCLKSGETDTALLDFQKVKELDPTNKSALSQIAACRKIIRDAHEKDKKLYANMFTKFASVDNEKEEIVRNEGSDVLSACGEWNMDEETRKEADLAFKEVDQNVVMI